MSTDLPFKCPHCRWVEFATLGELSKHLEKKHGLNEKKRKKIYEKMGYDEELK